MAAGLYNEWRSVVGMSLLGDALLTRFMAGLANR
jgi:hypothetical protein